MTENQTIKERLICFIKFLKIGQGKFEAQCGLANGYVNNIRRSITPDKLQQIALQFPELNTGWLMTGEGEMLRSTVSQTSHGNNSPNVYGDNNSVCGDAALLSKALDEISAMRIALADALKVNQENTSKLLKIVEAMTIK